MLKKTIYMIISGISFVLTSCAGVVHGGRPAAHSHHAVNMDFIFGAGAGTDRILNIVIKVLLIIALVLCIKFLYNKNKNNPPK